MSCSTPPKGTHSKRINCTVPSDASLRTCLYRCEDGYSKAYKEGNAKKGTAKEWIVVECRTGINDAVGTRNLTRRHWTGRRSCQSKLYASNQVPPISDVVAVLQMLFNGRALIFTFSRTQVRIAEIERL